MRAIRSSLKIRPSANFMLLRIANRQILRLQFREMFGPVWIFVELTRKVGEMH